jgi:hypothetical protein
MVASTPVGPEFEEDLKLKTDAFYGLQYLAEECLEGWITSSLKSQLVRKEARAVVGVGVFEKATSWCKNAAGFIRVVFNLQTCKPEWVVPLGRVGLCVCCMLLCELPTPHPPPTSPTVVSSG